MMYEPRDGFVMIGAVSWRLLNRLGASVLLCSMWSFGYKETEAKNVISVSLYHSRPLLEWAVELTLLVWAAGIRVNAMEKVWRKNCFSGED